MTKRADVPTLEILALCRARELAHFTTPVVHEMLADRYPPKVVLAKMEQMVRPRLLTYGVNIAGSWPTEKGLRFLEEAST